MVGGGVWSVGGKGIVHMLLFVTGGFNGVA